MLTSILGRRGPILPPPALSIWIALSTHSPVVPYDMEARAAASQAPAASTSSAEAVSWTAATWLSAQAEVQSILLDALLEAAGTSHEKGPEAHIEALCMLHKSADMGQGNLAHALRSKSDAIASVLTDALAPLDPATDLNSRFGSSDDSGDKMVAEPTGFVMSFGGLDSYFGGLEAVCGTPDPKVEQAMAREHTESADSSAKFKMPNRKSETTSQTEWHFVAEPEGKTIPPYPPPPQEPDAGADAEAWAKYEKKRQQYSPRQPHSYEHFKPQVDALNSQLSDAKQPHVIKAEFLGARLYTG